MAICYSCGTPHTLSDAYDRGDLQSACERLRVALVRAGVTDEGIHAELTGLERILGTDVDPPKPR